MKFSYKHIACKLISTVTLSTLLFITSCGNDQSAKEANNGSESATMTMLREMVEKTVSDVNPNGRIHFNNIGRYSEIFNDSNKYQYVYAEKFGIKPVENLRDAYHTSRPVVKTESCNEYDVAELTHSVPYLVPEAEMLLRLIGRNFIDSVHRRGGKGCRIIATSMLRTPQSVKRLRRVNVNATDSSCHKFATTFDISHRNFSYSDSTNMIDPFILKGILAEVLLDLRKQNLCMVKYERKTACFHITVTPMSEK